MSGTSSDTSAVGTHSYSDTANNDCGRATVQVTVNEGKGDKGDPGQAATIAVGNVTALDAGQAPTVVNSGTSTEAIFDFGIPKGDKGDKGDPGTPADPAAITALQNKTAKLSDDGTSYTGSVGGASDVNKADGVQGLDADGAIAAFTVTYGGGTAAPTYTGDGTAQVTQTIKQDGQPDQKATASLGTLLAGFYTSIAATQSTLSTLTLKTKNLTADGSRYDGDVGETSYADYDLTAGTQTRTTFDAPASNIAALLQNMGFPLKYIGAGPYTAAGKDGGNVLVMAGGTLTLGAFDGAVGVVAQEDGVQVVVALMADVDYSANPAKQPAARTLTLSKGDFYLFVSQDLNVNANAWYALYSPASAIGSKPLVFDSVNGPIAGSGLLVASSTNSTIAAGLISGAAAVTVGSSILEMTSASAPASLTSAGTLHEVRFDDTNGIIYRCVTGGADGAAKWVKFSADISDTGSGMMIETTGAPGTPTDAGTAGEVRYDASYVYVCVTTGAHGAAKWVRSAIDTTWTA